MKEVKRLLNKGIDVNTYDYDKRTGLHVAASKGLY
jgi:ankyrin repeat protein